MVSVIGDDAQDALESIVTLFDAGFDENNGMQGAAADS
jgi:hypothetical protein